jgi:hypothetical protein
MKLEVWVVAVSNCGEYFAVDNVYSTPEAAEARAAEIKAAAGQYQPIDFPDQRVWVHEAWVEGPREVKENPR